MKIAIIVPVYENAKAQFAESLTNLVALTATKTFSVDGVPTRPEIVTKFHRDVLPVGRNVLVDWALAQQPNYVLFADSDMVFPADALLRLLKHQKNIVGTNSPCRDADQLLVPTASMDLERTRLVHTTSQSPEIEPVPYIGLGFCLMTGSVLGRLHAAALQEGKPLFAFELLPDGVLRLEDWYFFDRVQRHGIQPYVDHSLSMEVGHIAETVLHFPRS